MDALSSIATVVAGLLVLAGAQKVIDPTTTVGALRALRLPASPRVVRLGSLAEVLLGIGAIVTGFPPLWTMVAASYLAFAVFVAAAMRNGSMIGSCGCFGREETPPHSSHVVLDVVLAGIAAAAAIRSTAPLDGLADQPVVLVLNLPLVALGIYVLHAAFVELPRTLQQLRS